MGVVDLCIYTFIYVTGITGRRVLQGGEAMIIIVCKRHGVLQRASQGVRATAATVCQLCLCRLLSMADDCCAFFVWLNVENGVTKPLPSMGVLQRSTA
jgi:hypothetical protein